MDKSMASDGRARTFRLLPCAQTWTAWDDGMPDEVLEDLVPYKKGYMRHSYISGGGKYLIKCYEPGRSEQRLVEPRVECGLLFLAQERGLTTLPKPYALACYSEDASADEDQRRDANAFVEEYIDGASIREIMGSGSLDAFGGRTSFAKDVALLSLAIARAIVGLRKLNVSHCCLSVDNIIVRGGVIGEAPEVVLTGFEHAMPVPPSTLIRPVYDVDTVYSAPECFFARIPVNRLTLASDVWSLGAIMTTMLCGSEAWSSWSRAVGRPCGGHELLSDDDMDYLERVRREPIDLAASMAATIGRRDGELSIGSQTFETLCRIVEACTEYHPRDRIGAEELVNALRGVLMRM